MPEPLVYKLNDIVEMKKPHACGANAWKVTRVGADIKLACTNCGREIMMPRFDFNKRLKKILVVSETN